MAIKFTQAEDDFIRENVDKCYTVYDLTEAFNGAFPNHPTTRDNLQHRMMKIGIKKGTHNIRPGAQPSRNALETVIWDGERGARVKTPNGYVSAHRYFKRKYFGENAEGMLVHLNGDRADFSHENIALVPKSIYHSLCWRSWFFTDAELTKTAILAAELLLFFPDLIHNENQYLKVRRNC